MRYVGIQTQQRRNNLKSAMLLCLFPLILIGATYLVCLFLGKSMTERYYADPNSIDPTLGYFLSSIPWVLGLVAVWFVIAYFNNSSMIRSATHSRPLQRRENPRVYNLVENLCMSQGMDMPGINIVEDDALNAFASGIDKKSYAVTLTTGIIERLDNDELEAVIAHELSHIRNRDVRLMIVSIIFVGIFAIIAEIMLRAMSASRIRSSRNSKDDNGVVVLMLLIMVLSAICYFITVLMRFAISRKREFMADAGSAEMTRNPLALASALRKISGDPGLEHTEREDVAQLFIFHRKKSGFFKSLFATHPPIEERIRVLEQF
ncbi:MAG: M48 family metallopeptidase [Rikenellaceae bacterium]|nr:M48 family metallopeptidase [Rikenellaceae bacterium]